MIKQLYILFLFTTLVSFGQEKKKHQDFNTMLKTLLSHTVKEVQPEDCNTNNITYLDARELQEYNVSHLNNAIWCGYNNFKIKKLKDIDKNSKIVVYCTVGYRSEKVTEKLEKAGFTNVSNLYGGIFAWVHANKKVYNKKGETKNIHTYDKNWSTWLKTGQGIY